MVLNIMIEVYDGHSHKLLQHCTLADTICFTTQIDYRSMILKFLKLYKGSKSFMSTKEKSVL